MVLIHGTNIIVDDFKTERPNRAAYVYFLTHFHRDSYEGLERFKGNEKIYCSNSTRTLLLAKFPNLKRVEGLDLEVRHTIFLDTKKTIYIDVTFFDANHCIGSIMILFTGYMGTILHTGHFRFTNKMLTDLKFLYPPSKRNSQNQGCSIHIDELILDDTYCDPIFNFPRRNEAFKAMVKIITKNPQKRFCIALDFLGKEELLVHLATHFKVQVAVDSEKYNQLLLTDYYMEYFTVNPEGTFLQVIKKSQIKEKLEEGAVIFVPTGWCNEVSVEVETNLFVSISDIQFDVVGYSLHSNFKELNEFLKSIKPAKLSSQLRSRGKKYSLEKLKKTKLNQFQRLKYMKQSGLKSLGLQYCDPLQLSEQYRNLLDSDILEVIHKELGLEKSYGSEKMSATLRDKNFSRKKSLRTDGEEESEVLDAIEIEEEGEISDSENQESVEDENEAGAKELWQKFYAEDLNKFGTDDVNEKEILEIPGQKTDNYIPFSDMSDVEEDTMDSDKDRLQGDSSNKNQKKALRSENNNALGMQEEDKVSKDKKEAQKRLPQKIFSGLMTLSITQIQKGETSELKEAFSMYTFQQLPSEYNIPKDINLQLVMPYSEAEPVIKNVKVLEQKENIGRKSYLTGWVESERSGFDSLFTKLANHMKKKGIVRYHKIDDQTTVYFLHKSQIDMNIQEHAPMLFLIVHT